MRTSRYKQLYSFLTCYGPVLDETQDASEIEATFLKINCFLGLKTAETSKTLSAREFCYTTSNADD